MVNTPKKPANQKGKSIYFNIDDPGELRLYQYAMSIKNFSGYMKAMLYSDLMKNNGHIPSPYNYATIMNTDISLQEPSLVVSSISTVDFKEEVSSESTVHSSPEPIVEKGSFTPEPKEPDELEDDLEDEVEDDLEDEVEEEIEEIEDAEDDEVDQDKDQEDEPPKPSNRRRNTSSFIL